MPLGMEIGFGPGDIVLDGDPALPTLKSGTATPYAQIVGPCLLGKCQKRELPRSTNTDVVWCKPFQMSPLPTGGSDA